LIKGAPVEAAHKSNGTVTATTAVAANTTKGTNKEQKKTEISKPVEPAKSVEPAKPAEPEDPFEPAYLKKFRLEQTEGTPEWKARQKELT